jgi:hypothetical protein
MKTEQTQPVAPIHGVVTNVAGNRRFRDLWHATDELVDLMREIGKQFPGFEADFHHAVWANATHQRKHMVEFVRDNPGCSIREIAKACRISYERVRQVIARDSIYRLEDAGPDDYAMCVYLSPSW